LTRRLLRRTRRSGAYLKILSCFRIGTTVHSLERLRFGELTKYSLRRLSARLQDAQAKAADGDASPFLTFDKDDDDTLDFVAASANLRSIIFGIETKSKFDIKR
jgi:hypothetical protein